MKSYLTLLECLSDIVIFLFYRRNDATLSGIVWKKSYGIQIQAGQFIQESGCCTIMVMIVSLIL